MKLRFRIRALQLMVVIAAVGALAVGSLMWHPLILVVFLGVVVFELALELARSH